MQSAQGARSRGSGPGTSPRGLPAEGSRPARLCPVPGPRMNVPAVHPYNVLKPFLCVCAGELGSLPTLPPLLRGCLLRLTLHPRNSWGQSVSSQGEVTGGERRCQHAVWGRVGRSPCAGWPCHVRCPRHTPQHLADPMGHGWCEEIRALSV